jgi:transcriptional regulator with PAS, ATPase and Fis domain
MDIYKIKMDYDNITLDEAKALIKVYKDKYQKYKDRQRKYQRKYIKDNPEFRKRNTLRTRRYYWKGIVKHLHNVSIVRKLTIKEEDKLIKATNKLKEIEEDFNLVGSKSKIEQCEKEKLKHKPFVIEQL